MTNRLNRITYAEDEPDIRAVAVLAMEKIGGYVVDACSNGMDAIERALNFQPDLILLDVMMPGLSGEETLVRMKEMPDFCGVPMAFMTAKAQTSEIERYITLGVSAVIPKPFDPITLPRRLHVIWRRYHQH